MKSIVAVFIFLMILFGCKSKQIPVTEYRNDSIQVEKVITVANPVDSANIRALLECNENGKVVLSRFDEEVSKNTQLRFKLDSLGNLVANFKSGGDSIKTVYIDKEIKRIKTVYRPVPAEISKWNRWMINLGYCLLGIFGIFFIYGICILSKIKLSKLIPFI